jgi:hypothetical protein
VKARRAKFDLRCPSDETVLTVVEGEATVEASGATRTVLAGEQVKIVAGRIAAEQMVRDPLFDTRWVHELLALKGADDPEMAERINDFLARVGQAKMATLYEDEIRRLGEPAVWPLMRYLASSGAEVEPAKRRTAARIVADLAGPRAIGDLIELLADADDHVRSEVARSLERLTGHDQGRPAEDWRADWLTCEPTQRQWRQWWDERRQRATDETPATTPPGKARLEAPMQKARGPLPDSSPKGKS